MGETTVGKTKRAESGINITQNMATKTMTWLLRATLRNVFVSIRHIGRV